MKLWNVYRTSQVSGEQFGQYLCSVEAESASGATGIASAGTMTSRLDLVAYPDEIDGRKANWPDWAPRFIALDERRPGRPREYEGRERTSLMLSSALLNEIDKQRGAESRSVYIERVLRQIVK